MKVKNSITKKSYEIESPAIVKSSPGLFFFLKRILNERVGSQDSKAIDLYNIQEATRDHPGIISGTGGNHLWISRRSDNLRLGILYYPL